MSTPSLTASREQWQRGRAHDRQQQVEPQLPHRRRQVGDADRRRGSRAEPRLPLPLRRPGFELPRLLHGGSGERLRHRLCGAEAGPFLAGVSIGGKIGPVDLRIGYEGEFNGDVTSHSGNFKFVLPLGGHAAPPPPPPPLRRRRRRRRGPLRRRHRLRRRRRRHRSSAASAASKRNAYAGVGVGTPPPHAGWPVRPPAGRLNRQKDGNSSDIGPALQTRAGPLSPRG